MIFVGEGEDRDCSARSGGRGMAYVTPIYGGSAAQIDYRLGITQHGCGSDVQFRYRADPRERPLRWIGNGLPEFGLDDLAAGAELTTEQHDLARALMAGKHPVTGEQLVAPKVAVPADAKVPLGPLVAAVKALAAKRGLDDPAALFVKPKQRSAWNTAVRAVARRGDAALLRVDDALGLAEAVGLEAERVWPGVDLLAVFSNLYESAVRVGKDGKPELDERGRPSTELVPRRVPVGIVGFDIGVTLPKSASLLLAFLPDELVDRVEAGYTSAIERTFGWVENRTSYVRRGKHGDGHTARLEQTSGFAGWVMTHRAARPVEDAPVGDPHWHVHITVANMAKAPDGTWLTAAAGGRDLMRHAPAIDKVTQAQVRAFLHNELGITFTRSPRTGLWEVAQVPDEAIVYFSKRGQQVSAVLEQLGYSNADVSAAEARVLTRASRSAKSETTAASDATLRDLWRSDALRGGLDPDALMDQVLGAYRSGATAAPVEANSEVEARYGISLDELVATLTDPERGLTAHARRFSHLDAIAAVADALPRGAAIEDVERLTGLALAHAAFEALPTTGSEPVAGLGARTQLAGAHQMTGGQLYTTRDVTTAERTILAAATASEPGTRDAPPRAVVPVATVDLAIGVVETAQGFPLSAEQRDVLHRVVTTGRAVEAVEGPPGTGKTTLMRAARVAWEAVGHRVAGAATAAVAAQNLAAESGILSRTVAQWLWRIDNGDGLAGVDVLVLDEANLTNDRDRATLYTAAAETGTKIVEVGDPRQLRGVGVGSMFGYLHSLLGGPRLTEPPATPDRRTQRAHRVPRRPPRRSPAHLGTPRRSRRHRNVGPGGPPRWTPPGYASGTVLPIAHPDRRPAHARRHQRTSAADNDATQAVRHARGELGHAPRTGSPAAARPASTSGTWYWSAATTATSKPSPATPSSTATAASSPPSPPTVSRSPRAILPPSQTRSCPRRSSRPATSPRVDSAGLRARRAQSRRIDRGRAVGAAGRQPQPRQRPGLHAGPGQPRPLRVAVPRQRPGRPVRRPRRTEGEREDLVYGRPRTHRELTDRVIAALAEQAAATAETANDRPCWSIWPRPADPSGTGTTARHATGTSTGTSPGTRRQPA